MTTCVKQRDVKILEGGRDQMVGIWWDIGVILLLVIYVFISTI